MQSLEFDRLDETEFEEFCFELLGELGFVNVDWRKGTALQGSPSDRGRDIVGQREHIDVDGTRHIETWFVDCKHYKSGVPPTALQNLLAWAHAERPHVALFIASGFLSNPSKDYLSDYENNNRPPFRIKFWERPVLTKLTRGNRDLLERFLLNGMRTQSEILAAEQEFFDRVWHERHLVFRDRYEAGDPGRATEEIYQQALAAAEQVKARYPDVRPVESDFEWGMWNGKLSLCDGCWARTGTSSTRDSCVRTSRPGGQEHLMCRFAPWLFGPELRTSSLAIKGHRNFLALRVR